MSTAEEMTRTQKAAAILVAMGKPSASKLLKFFKQEELKALVEGARLLRTISQADLEKIVAEFEAEFTEGAGLLDSGDKMDTILTETLSQEEMDAIMGVKKEEKVVDAPQPVWPQLEKIEPERIGAFLAAEHAQTASMLLSKLAPQTAANVLLTLEKSQRSEIINRMVSLTAIPDAAIKIIENQGENVTSSLLELAEAGLIGLLLSIAVLYFFLRHWASTLMVTLAIPICFVMTLGFMYFAGVTLNILSMMGLLLAIGMLVDNAVVVVESIYQEREKNPGNPRLASILGTRHVAIVPPSADSRLNEPPRPRAFWSRLSRPLRRAMSPMPMPSSTTTTTAQPSSTESSREIPSAWA